MKNLFKIFVVVAGMAAALYSCEPKNNQAEGTPQDSIFGENAPAPDSLATTGDSATTVKADSGNTAQ